MRILVACEYSGTVRDAFAAAGHDAWSCDLLPSESPGQHVQGDALELARSSHWDMVIAHPPCTYLANSGVCRLWELPSGREADGVLKGPERWAAMFKAAAFFNAFKDSAPFVAIENPIPHCYARDLIGDYTQCVQPWQFGHRASKATCFWLKGLPPLKAVNAVKPTSQPVMVLSSSNPDRAKIRAKTYTGIAKAMANQWSRPWKAKALFD